MATISPYEKITFEEAARILYFSYSTAPAIYRSVMEDLLSYGHPPYKAVTPASYESYKSHLEENKKSK
jgi:hypothetical protein